MSLGANALTSWDRVKSSLGFTTDEHQAAAEFLIDAVSATANRISGRKLKARDYTDLRLDGSGRDTIILPEYPIVSLTGIYVDRSRTFGDDTALASTIYQILADSGMVRLIRRFPLWSWQRQAGR